MPNPDAKVQHHCQCRKTTKASSDRGYCKKCQKLCTGQGSAIYLSGVEVPIEHGRWVHGKNQICSYCSDARERIETSFAPPEPAAGNGNKSKKR
ncbi:hypothetical protein M408DRAFT_328004 [Serendipita vermifera MAFF 305830]|uniref:Uncharacterized protein n=1 Tax=Serendipita vermifera MAFF 305830 TaxID=933852 RepID=A0A0C3BFX0_SERVB|nr:hypothetical protein M408DRAFT_328004 [Serendipita vermifera MAFF 305830]